MRMKCLRILPEMWARTAWPLSSFTRNMALGRVSSTVASTSIASSLFDKRYLVTPGVTDYALRSHDLGGAGSLDPDLPARLHAQHPGSVLGHRHRELEMGRQRTIGGSRRPA